MARSQLTRLTFTGVASDPVWTRDGASVCYVGRTELFCQSFDGASPPRPLLTKTGLSTVTDFSPDGTALLDVNAAVRFDIWRRRNGRRRP